MKTIGIVLIFICSSYFGYALSSVQKKRYSAGVVFLDLVKSVRNSIEFFGAPLCDIYKNADCNGISKEFDRELKAVGMASACRKFGKCIPSCVSMHPTPGEFADKLGGSFPEGELRLCDSFIKVYSEFLDKERLECEKKQRLYVSMGILIGVMAVILLW